MGKKDDCRGKGKKSCDTTVAETTTTEPETTTTTTEPETTTTTTEPETTTTTTEPETTTTTEPETTTTTTEPETTTTTTEPETTTTTTEPETTTTTTEPETTTTTTEPETTTTTTEPETTTTTTEPETTTTTTEPETTTTTTEPETTTTTTEPETTTTTTEPETTTTTTEPETTTTTTEPETTTTTEAETTTPGSTFGSIYTQRCHDPPSLASGRGRYINSTTFRYWCGKTYSLQGFNYIYCINNKWVGPMPQCVPTYANPNVDSIIKVNREISQAEPLPDWFLLAMLGFFGVVALSCLIAMLMCCLHLVGCYSGPVFSFGARHVYPRGPLCKCQDYCCCCCRCCKFCKMCCVGDEGEEDEDEEQKVAMLENENANQYPEPGTVIDPDVKGQEGQEKVKKKKPTSNVKVRNKPTARIQQV